MKNTQVIELITGSFTTEEAKQILSGLIKHKIDFHYMKNFSSEQRLGVSVQGSRERIQELNESRKKVFELIEKAFAEGRHLKISSTIIIEVE